MPAFFVKHLCSIPPPYGGVTVYVKRLSLSLSKRGLLSGAFTNILPYGIPADYRHLFCDKSPAHLNSFWAIIELPKLLREFSKYQIIHNHYGVNTAFILYALHKLLRKPAVWTIHNQMIDREFAGTNGFDHYFYKKLACDSNVQIVAVNTIEKEALEKLGYKYANSIKVIPAYVPPVEIGRPDDYLDKELVSFIRSDAPIILFYAESFAEYNNQVIYGTDTIINLFVSLKERYTNLKIVFCIVNGNSFNDKLGKLKQTIQNSGYSNDVYWQVGPIPEMWPLLKACRVLVRPTCTDGDSVMVREALAFGLPVVTSDVTLRPKGCIIYHYGNMDELLTKTENVIVNPIRKIYPQVDYSDIMLNVFNKLLNNK